MSDEVVLVHGKTAEMWDELAERHSQQALSAVKNDEAAGYRGLARQARERAEQARKLEKRAYDQEAETAYWVLRINITEPDSWDDVPDRLREIADRLSDLPLTETLWDRRGRLLGEASVEVVKG